MFLPGDVVVTGSGSVGDGLIHIDPTTGNQTLISSGSFGDFAIADNHTTVYAIESGTVVKIDVATGSKTTVSSGGQLVDPSGIAVDRFGQIHVLDLGSAGGDGAIIQIDPTSGGQMVLSSGGLLTEGDRGPTDLEISPMGDLIVLTNDCNVCDSSVFAVDVTGGQQDLIDALYQGTGLGITQNGDIYVSSGTAHTTSVVKIDAVTGESEWGGNVTTRCNVGEDNENWFDLVDTDMAFGPGNSNWMVGYGAGGGGLWVWDVEPLCEFGGVPFSEGFFYEVQVVGAATQIPEPGSALLFSVGFLAIGASTSKRTSRDGL
jgi:hypothetical protein